MLDAGEADPVDADHHAGAAGRQHRVVAAPHLVDRAGDVDRVHRHAAEPVGVRAEHRHHRLEPRVERRVGRVADQLVVLDEVDAGRAERIDQRGGLLRRQADARLDDGADQRPALHARLLARACDAEAGPAKPRAYVGRQVEIEQAQAGDLAELEQVAGDRGEQASAGWRRHWRPGRRSRSRPGGTRRRAAGARRRRSAATARGPAAAASMRTTRARERSFSASVSPGSDRNVPLDCSPAITSAAFSDGHRALDEIARGELGAGRAEVTSAAVTFRRRSTTRIPSRPPAGPNDMILREL